MTNYIAKKNCHDKLINVSLKLLINLIFGMHIKFTINFKGGGGIFEGDPRFLHLL